MTDEELAILLSGLENRTYTTMALTPPQREAIEKRIDLIFLHESGRWRLTLAGKAFARKHDPRFAGRPIDANDIWRQIRHVIQIDTDEVVEACRAVGMPTARSRIQGWSKHPGDRKHTRLSLEELHRVLEAIAILDRGYIGGDDDGR